MNYHSLAGRSPAADFRTATLSGQAPDGGLYFPDAVPLWSEALRDAILQGDMTEAGLRVMQPYVGGCIPEAELRRIVAETLCFPIPLVRITEDISALELFHGPTLAFKDVGARFMSRCLGYFAAGTDGRLVVLVATSGDTGGAVADGFHGVPNVDVVILYPSGKVSPVQEKQLTTLGRNIHALEVGGDFDDCQRMVKAAFRDEAVNARLRLTSANSINVARWLPQQLYYLMAWRQWAREEAPVICVPSGNFGNICAGMLAWASGMPVAHFIAACNANDTVPRFLNDGAYAPLPSVATLSNAMDVADPSNFTRILKLFAGRDEPLPSMLSACSISDRETMETMRRVAKDSGYQTDPHGAVGYLALERWLAANPGHQGYFLETAHPVKFPDAVSAATGSMPAIPDQLGDLMAREKKAEKMAADVSVLRDYLMAMS